MNWRFAVIGAVGLAFGAALMFLFTVFDQPPDEAASQTAVSNGAAEELAMAAVPYSPNRFSPATPAPVSETTPNDGSPTEGIKVHGDWTIDILEPDGTVVSHNEFENALIGTGSRRIAQILAKEILPRYWGIRIRHNTLSNSPCILDSNNSAYSCVLYEPNGIDASFTSNNLNVTAGNDGVLTLSGTIAAQRDGQISSVTTLHAGRPCSDGASYPSGCVNNAGTEVTRAIISPIDVVDGQVISVTVRLSFE